MKVKELVAILDELDGEREVVVSRNGYDSAVYQLATIEIGMYVPLDDMPGDFFSDEFFQTLENKHSNATPAVRIP